MSPRAKRKSPAKKAGPTVDDLLDAANEVRERAYAPYSRFRVGAALLTKSGEVVTGCNVENASYGLSVCAERAAIVRAVAEGHDAFDTLAVITGTSPPAPPCGTCLQTLSEFADDLRVIIANDTGEKVHLSLKALLPFRFRPEMLGDA
jgi:cytidine deaminase